ncbi:LysR family transcriptional regulator [Roseovarius aestuarii]|nr:LysR family transcriptional regulator [Roseovarius aestuarii]
MLNATWLETFTTLCDIGHFTRTAEQLAMTQPGVSQHLRKLEAQVGKPLITQVGKSFDLTAAGEAVLAVGLARREQERDLEARIQVDDPDKGEINIACSGSFAMWVYPHLLDRMHSAPDLVIRVTAMPHSSIVKGVLSGDIDLGVVAEHVDHPRLEATRIGSEELCLVAPAAFDEHNVDLKALNALGFVAHPDGYAYADDLFTPNFAEEYRGADRLKIRTFINQIGQIPIPVAQGLGYTILPQSGVDAFAAKQDLKIVQLPIPRRHDLWLVSMQGRAEFARVAAIGELIKRASLALGGV